MQSVLFSQNALSAAIFEKKCYNEVILSNEANLTSSKERGTFDQHIKGDHSLLVGVGN